MELIYSRQATDFIKGRAYANPRFYSRPRAGVTKVYVVGDWPQIEADYAALGVEVVKLFDGTTVAASALDAPPPAQLSTAVDPVDRGDVEIPEGWEGLAWPDLRKLAQQLADEPVLNKTMAAGYIETELQRRAKAQEVRASVEIDEPMVAPAEDAE